MTLSTMIKTQLTSSLRNSLFPAGFAILPRQFTQAGIKTKELGARWLSESCQSKKDQTPEASLKVLQTTKDPMTKGTGLFLVPDPEKGILETRVVLVRDLTYPETIKRGTNCEAYKWIAQAHLTISQIEAERKRCPEIWCGNSHNLCPPSCFCSYLFCRG